MSPLSAVPTRLRPAILLAVFVLSVAGIVPIYAQVADGVITVTVVDESNQVMPGVTVTVVRPDTGFQQVGTQVRLPLMTAGSHRQRCSPSDCRLKNAATRSLSRAKAEPVSSL